MLNVMFSGFAFGESAFYIFYTVVGGVTVEVIELNRWRLIAFVVIWPELRLFG